jgi:chemotaxis protein histidine kinase CheA
VGNQVDGSNTGEEHKEIRTLEAVIKLFEAGGVDDAYIVPSRLRLAALQTAKNAAKPIWTQLRETANKLKQVQHKIATKTARASAIAEQQEVLAQEAQQNMLDILKLQDTEVELRLQGEGSKIEFDDLAKRLPELSGIPASALESDIGKDALAALQAALAGIAGLKAVRVVPPKSEPAEVAAAAAAAAGAAAFAAAAAAAAAQEPPPTPVSAEQQQAMDLDMEAQHAGEKHELEESVAFAKGVLGDGASDEQLTQIVQHVQHVQNKKQRCL